MASCRRFAGHGALKGILVGLVFVVSAAAGAHGSTATPGRPSNHSVVRDLGRWSPHIAEAAARFGIPEEWIRRVMRAESAGRTALDGRPITSRAGAMGLMQLMPRTWAEMRDLHGLGHDPHNPRDNILAGAAYLRAMFERFGYPGLFAAYNAGPKRYAEHLATGRPLPSETIAYAVAVGRRPWQQPAALARQTPISGVFVPLAVGSRENKADLPSAVPKSLFVQLSTGSAPTE